MSLDHPDPTAPSDLGNRHQRRRRRAAARGAAKADLRLARRGRQVRARYSAARDLMEIVCDTGARPEYRTVATGGVCFLLDKFRRVVGAEVPGLGLGEADPAQAEQLLSSGLGVPIEAIRGVMTEALAMESERLRSTGRRSR